MTDDRERWGRAVHEARVAHEQKTGHPFSLPWEGRARVAREEDMAIGSAVAAQAVRDAGLENERMKAQLFALGAHMPAIRRALVGAIGDAEYEHDKKQYRAALHAVCGGDKQERSDEKETPR